MSTIDAYHLPGLKTAEIERWSVREYGDGVRLRVPVLSPAHLEHVIQTIRAAREQHLADLPVEEIVAVIDAAAERFADPDSPERQLLHATLPAVTGYSEPMVRLVLDTMSADWRADALGRLLTDEFGDPCVLDTFRPQAGHRDVRAYGPAFAWHVFSGNVPGVAITSLVRSLLVKATTLGKTASGDPLFPAIFARVLAKVSPELGECIAVTYWSGGDHALETVALAAADTVIVYGGEATVESIRERIPHGTRLVEHGPKLSLALVGAEVLSDDGIARVADAAARAVATFDQQGCVSPHVIYVEDGGHNPEAFAARLFGALEELSDELPRGQISPAEAATIQQVRGAAEFKALAGDDTRLFASQGTEHTVIYEADPGFTASSLNRVIRVKPVERLEDVAAQIEPYAHYLQTVGIAVAEGRRLEIAERFGRIGAARVTTLDAMAWPPPSWHHDGQGPLRELVRWTDLEG